MSVASQVWSLAPVLLKPRVIVTSTVKTILIDARRMVNLPTSGLTTTPLYPWILWHLWKARNQCLFEDHCYSEMETLVKAITDAKQWQLAQKIPINVDKPAEIPQRSSNITCYVDAAWNSSSRWCGLGWIVLDSTDVSLFFDSTTKSFIPSAFWEEGFALKEALMACLREGFLSLRVWSDSQVLITLLQKNEDSTELSGVLRDIRMLSLLFSSISFSFIPRARNSLADSLAKYALSSLNVFSPGGV